MKHNSKVMTTATASLFIINYAPFLFKVFKHISN